MNPPADQATQLRKIMAQPGAQQLRDPAADHARRRHEAPQSPMPQRHASPDGLPEPTRQSRARTIAISSGKGGVGKTNVAINLAARLAQMKRRVVVMDADLGLANADVLCNMSSTVNLAHVVTGRKTMKQAMAEAPGGFVLVPGASGLASMAGLSEFERARLVEALREIDRTADLVIIDTGAGISPNVLTFVLACDELLMVTTPEPTAMTDAYALIKTISRRREDAHVSLLVNMVKDRHEARTVFERTNAVCRRFLGLPLRDAGYIVTDPRVSLSVRRRVPFVLDHPDSPASTCVGQLAHRLDSQATEIRDAGLLKRFATWLAG